MMALIFNAPFNLVQNQDCAWIDRSVAQFSLASSSPIALALNVFATNESLEYWGSQKS